MKKKTVLITGSSRGIGAEMAKLFAEADYNVVINYNKSKEKGFAVYDEIIAKGGSAIIIKADVRIKSEVQNLVNQAVKIFGKIDILINNAGIAMDKLFVDTLEEDFDDIFNTNIKGNYLATREVLPIMLKNEFGRIINIASIWGQTGGSLETIYSASKASVIGLTKALAKEYALSNIRVNAISPGAINTDMLTANRSDKYLAYVKRVVPIGKLGQPTDIANMALFLASEKADYITGQVFAVNGGFYI